MISDRLDEGIHKEALEMLDHLKQEVRAQRTSGFDTETKQVVYGEVEYRAEGFDIAIRHISGIETESTPSCLAIVADVISNSLFRHLRSMIEASPDIRLHSKAAASDFSLSSRIAFLDDNYIVDTLYSPSANG